MLVYRPLASSFDVSTSTDAPNAMVENKRSEYMSWRRMTHDICDLMTFTLTSSGFLLCGRCSIGSKRAARDTCTTPCRKQLMVVFPNVRCEDRSATSNAIDIHCI